jgi:hypothetical protein
VRSPKNYLILLLLVTTFSTALVAWRQSRELVALREKLALSAAAAAARHSAKPTPGAVDSPEVASAVPSPSDDKGPGATPPARASWNRNGRADFAAMMDRPEVQRLMAVQRKAELDSRYSALFRQLNLTPEQLDAFKNLLVEKSTAMLDVRAVAREQGISPRTDPATYLKLVTDAQAQIDDNIRSQLGDAAFSQYKDYEQTLPQRNLVTQLEQRLSYSSTPLSPAQSTQMVAILAATSPAPAGPVTPLAVMGDPGRTRAVPVTDATLNQALGVLAAPQLDALRQIQQEQQAQAQLSKAMRTPPSAPPPNGG